MTDKDPFQLIDEAMSLDPREAAYGMFIGGSFVMDSVRVFVWFRSKEELIHHIVHIEPVSREFDQDNIERLKQKLEPLTNEFLANGPSEVLREQVNRVISSDWVIDWWGQFNDLKDGSDEFSKCVLASFYDGDETNLVVKAEDIEEFVEFLSQYNV